VPGRVSVPAILVLVLNSNRILNTKRWLSGCVAYDADQHHNDSGVPLRIVAMPVTLPTACTHVQSVTKLNCRPGKIRANTSEGPVCGGAGLTCNNVYETAANTTACDANTHATHQTTYA